VWALWLGKDFTLRLCCVSLLVSCDSLTCFILNLYKTNKGIFKLYIGRTSNVFFMNYCLPQLPARQMQLHFVASDVTHLWPGILIPALRSQNCFSLVRCVLWSRAVLLSRLIDNFPLFGHGSQVIYLTVLCWNTYCVVFVHVSRACQGCRVMLETCVGPVATYYMAVHLAILLILNVNRKFTFTLSIAGTH